MRVTVLGAGVIGLLASVELCDDGHEVVLVARDLGPATTSARAGASFKPSSIDRSAPYTELLHRSAEQLRRWDADGRSDQRAVSRIRHVEASSTPLEPGDHLDLVDDVEWLDAASGDDIPGGYRHAVVYTTWFFDVPRTMAALAAELRERGVEVRQQDIADLDELWCDRPRPDVVVNAAGLGARDLTEDEQVVAVQGQTVLVDTPAGQVPSISADGFYIYPRADGLLLGGTAVEDAWGELPSRAVTQLLLRGNARVVPALLDAVPRRVDVGLRPYRRGGVRLELDGELAVPVVHAYGHGGAGWTLGPGTAIAVAELVADALGDR